MKRAKKIIFEKIKFTKNGIRFYYLINNIQHSYFNSIDYLNINFDQKQRYLISAHIGLSYLIDLAVICCPEQIEIRTIGLSKKQLNFWKWVYENIAVERAYMEKAELLFMNTRWKSPGKIKTKLLKKRKNEGKLSIAVSGGKESLAALGLFDNIKDLSLFFLDYRDKNSFHMRKVYENLGRRYPYFRVNSTISYTDKLVKQYKCKDYSMFVIGQVIFNALLFSDKIDYLAIGNEYSSNFGNVIYKNKFVNHQFDKTIEFAKKINEYINEYLDANFKYFSPFFGFYEYQITKFFFKGNSYLDIWTSCNNSNKNNNFCCNCPKCAFIYIISLPFIGKERLKKYFWKNPLENLRLCKPLIDFKGVKPIDCVGEKKECWLALYKILNQRKDTSSPVMKFFKEDILSKIKGDLPKIAIELNKEHTNFKYIPKQFRTAIRDRMLIQG